MSKKSPISCMILDYDGTCTQIPLLYKGFLHSFQEGFTNQLQQQSNVNLTVQEWEEALHQVRKHSPHVGWTIATCPSAPAAADPYILASEASNLILREMKLNTAVDPKIFPNAYASNPPAWRKDASSTFKALQQHGIRLFIVSNSTTAAIQQQLGALEGVTGIEVLGSAAKYAISELHWDPKGEDAELPQATKQRFLDLPASEKSQALHSLGRPAYLRRGSYFEAICRVLGGDLGKLATTVICGDVWELDLAMPQALGANIHLMERAEPFGTYAYEIEVVKGYAGNAIIGQELSDLLKWVVE